MIVINNITNNYRYFDIRPLKQVLMSLPENYKAAIFYSCSACNIISGDIEGNVVVYAAEVLDELSLNTALSMMNAVALDFNFSTYYLDFNSYLTLKESLKIITIGDTTAYDALLSCPELTKEEFYNLSE